MSRNDKILFGFALPALSALVACYCCGCSLIRGEPKVTIDGGGLLSPVNATAPKDNGKPAAVDSSGEESRIDLPAGSVITVTRTEAQPATDKTPARPAFEVREIRLASDSAWFERAQHIAANTGTVDTSVALRKADNAARQPLLYAAIASALAAIALMFIGPWPKVATLAGIASAVFFAAWQAAALPAWFWMIGAGLLIGGAFLMVGWWVRDQDGNGIPDRLEKKTTT